MMGGADTSGFLGGGQVGCNYQVANFVIGVEADAAGTTLSGTGGQVLSPPLPPGGNASAKTDFIADVTGRLGYASGPWLFYAKGGGAWSHNAYSLVTSTGDNWSWSGTRSGWTIGGGIEWAFWQNWSAKLEYQYYDFGGSGTLTDLTGVTTTGSYTQYVHAVMVGLNYHFWTGPGPVATRY